jgi:hypothetical protein
LNSTVWPLNFWVQKMKDNTQAYRFEIATDDKGVRGLLL